MDSIQCIAEWPKCRSHLLWIALTIFVSLYSISLISDNLSCFFLERPKKFAVVIFLIIYSSCDVVLCHCIILFQYLAVTVKWISCYLLHQSKTTAVHCFSALWHTDILFWSAGNLCFLCVGSCTENDCLESGIWQLTGFLSVFTRASASVFSVSTEPAKQQRSRCWLEMWLQRPVMLIWLSTGLYCNDTNIR